MTAAAMNVDEALLVADAYFLPADQGSPTAVLAAEVRRQHAEIERLRAALADVAAEMPRAVLHERNRCAWIARNGCLVPPDGGSPTEDERLLCDEIERRIRAEAA